MTLCDVSVLLNASAPEAEHHALCYQYVRGLGASNEPFGISELVLAAVIRLATNPRVFRPPASLENIFAFANALRNHPRAVSVAPGRRHWGIFQDLVLQTGIRGSDTTDAYLAALAMEHACEWWTTDSGFGRFAGLRWRNLLGE